MVLTKDEILNLPKTHREVETDVGTIKIRSLTPTELSEVRLIRAVGTVTTNTTSNGTETSRTVDMSEYVGACEKAKLTSLMYSLSVEETWTFEEVKRIPVPILSQLYDVVMEWNALKEE